MNNISDLIKTINKDTIINCEDNYKINLLYDNKNLNYDKNTDVIILSNLKCYYISFGDYYLCEIDILLENYINDIVDCIYIYSPIYGWFYTVYNKLLNVLINDTKINVIKCSKIVIKNKHDIFDYISDENTYTYIINIPVVQARCQHSMKILDFIHRKFLNNYELKANEIIAIKAVAGSGKTTTILKLAKKNKKYYI